MAEVLFFSYHNTKAWWQYLADNLNFTKSARLISDLRESVDICIVDDFYQNFRTRDCERIAIQKFSPSICDDIIRRCRVLRNLEKSKALNMIGSMWLVFDEIVRKEQPKLVVSFIIDRYLLDVLNRVLESYGIPFIGMTASIVPDQVMFMSRGKLIPVREPEMDEIEQSRKQLLNDSFAPSYVKSSKKFSRSLYWKTFLYFKLRGIAFQFIRYLNRDKLNLHYLDALNFLEHKPRLLDYKVLNYLNEGWEQRLNETLKEKRVFLPLQLLPEASLDYWLDDLSLLDNDKVILEISRVLGDAGYTVFIKDHPLQFGFRKRGVIQKLMKLPHVVIVPYDIPATRLIKECNITITFTGTVGFQSVLAGACSIVSGAYYSDEEHFVHFNCLSDIASLPEKIAQFKKGQTQSISDNAIDGLLAKVLAASAPGDLFTFRKFDRTNAEHVRRVQPLVDSLNKYLPPLMSKKREEQVC